jgi:hypothetical protein
MQHAVLTDRPNLLAGEGGVGAETSVEGEQDRTRGGDAGLDHPRGCLRRRGVAEEKAEEEDVPYLTAALVRRDRRRCA